MIDIRAIVVRLREDNPGLADVAKSDVTDVLDADRTKSWRGAADELVDVRIDDADLTGAVHDLIAEQLAEQDE